jgi:phosphatidylinositol-3-phosphatase
MTARSTDGPAVPTSSVVTTSAPHDPARQRLHGSPWRRWLPLVAAGVALLSTGGGLAGPASATAMAAPAADGGTLAGPVAAPVAGPVAAPVAAPVGPAARGTGQAAAAAVARRPSKVLVVVLENRDASRVAREMPYLSAQARRYGSATHYFGITHPSLPNYLMMAGGSTFRVRDDHGPAAHRLSGASVFGQALAHRRTARTYAEGMKANCQSQNTGRYAVRHNPWTYFPRERAVCRRDDVPSGTPARGALHNDIAAGRLPNVGLLVPDVCNDAHDCSLGRADRWLRSWLRAVQAGPDWRAGRLALVVTFDEDDHSAGNHVATVVMHPSLHGVRVSRRMDHRDLSASASRLAGGRPLRDAKERAGLLAAFHLA